MTETKDKSPYCIDIRSLVYQEMKNKLTRLCVNVDKVQDIDYLMNEMYDCLEAFTQVQEKVGKVTRVST